MATLGGISSILGNINSSRTQPIKVLHALIFEEDGDRKNRQRLREFAGFSFKDDADEYEAKLSFIDANFSLSDLISIANILCLDYDGSKEELKYRILSALCDLNTLIAEIDSDEDDDDFKNDELGKKKKDGDLDKSEDNAEPKDEEREEKTKDEEREEKTKDEEREEKTKEKKKKVTSKNVSRKGESVRSQDTRDSESEAESEALSVRTTAQSPTFAPRFNMSSRDVDEALQKFSGDDDFTITRWIEDFEEMAHVFQWSPMEKLLYGKKSLSGTARLFLRSERGIISWQILKKRLLVEFRETVNSAAIHKKLNMRKKKADETLQQYLLCMKEIGGQGNIEEAALIDYIIQGVPDEEINKAILYGAKSLEELKDKL